MKVEGCTDNVMVVKISHDRLNMNLKRIIPWCGAPECRFVENANDHTITITFDDTAEIDCLIDMLNNFKNACLDSIGIYKEGV